MLENSVMHVKLFLRKTGNLRSRLIFALLILIRPLYTVSESLAQAKSNTVIRREIVLASIMIIHVHIYVTYFRVILTIYDFV